MSQNVEKIRLLLNQGSALHQLGKLEEAKLIYEEILKINIKQFEANHFLGTLFAQMGQHSSAIEFLNKAILINPNLHETYSNLGNAYLESNQFGKAIKTYDKSIKLKPSNAKDYSNRGIAFHNLRKYTEAINNFDKAIELKIDYENAYVNKANTLIEIGEIDKAITCYEKSIEINLNYHEAYLNLALAKLRLKKYEDAIITLDQALEIKPDFPDAFMNKGIALIELGKSELAFECFQKAIDLEPQSPAVYCNLGVAQTSLGNLNEAIQSFNKAIEFKSDFADAFSGRAIAQIKQGEFDKAEESYKIAIEINPHNASYYLNLGNALAEQRRFEESIANYDKAIELKIDYAAAYANRGHVLITYLNDPAGALVFFEVALGLQPDFSEAYINQGQAFSNLNQIEKSINSFLKALEINPNSPFVIGKCLHQKMKICDWDNLQEGISICESLFYNNIPATVPFEALTLFDDPEIQLISAKLTNDLKYKNLVPVGNFPKRVSKEKIRIGYYSADLYYHPVSIWLAEQIENHDKNKFELFAFCMKSVVDPMRTRLENAFDHWIEIESMSDVQVTQLSRDFEIDIAIDLNGHTAHSRPGIFAARAAPLQINHLGFPGTLGVDYIDYYISDYFFVTQTNKKHFKEKIAYLPCHYTYDRQRQISVDKITRQQFSLPEDSFIFTCQNSYQKIMPEVFDVWMQILNAVPKSVLWLADQNQVGKENLLKEAELRGVDGNRLIFCKRELVLKELEQSRIGKYLASYKLADLFLDTWPYNAGTTALDALWAGLPVLTKAGISSAARMATSALNAIEMPELIANNQEEYKNLAIRFANEQEYFKQIKDKLKRNILTTPLFDPVGNTKYIEKAYIEMFNRHQAGQKPEDIYIKN